MAKHAMKRITVNRLTMLIMLGVFFFLSGCSAPKKAVKNDERLVKEDIPPTPAWKVHPEPPKPPEPPPPSFVSVTDEIVPLKTKMVNIVVRNSPLGDILHVLADASGLNLMVESDVPIDQPMTLSLKNISAEDAMKAIFSNLDCYYTIDNNILRVESASTKIFELGHPALVNTFSMDVGGDILSASGTTGGLKGTITSGSKSDGKAFDFWGALETSLTGVMDKRETKSKAQQTVTINRMTGTIMVTASRKNIDKVERYLENVRKVLSRQVMIEARIVEVNLNDGLKFGIDWSFLKYASLLGGPVSGGFGALSLASSVKDIAATADTSKFRIGLAKTDFNTLLTALKDQGEIKTLSNPKVNVMNGHASILTVGTNTSFISKVTTTTTATAAGNVVSFTPEATSVLSGMIIGIVPYISEKGDITLNITPITSELTDQKSVAFGSGGNTVTITIPTVALREMTTTVKMRDGQMVILGGLIQKKESTNDAKIPLIGDIPYVGRLFTRTTNSESRSELVLLMRAHIVENE